MDILFAVIGVLIGGGLGYWWQSRQTTRTLPVNAVWLFPLPDSKHTENSWRVALEEQHKLWEPPPTLWTLPKHEHTFTLEGKHSLSCQDNERVDVTCVIHVRPKRNTDRLQDLLDSNSLEQLNDATWVFKTLQLALKTSTTVLKKESRATWLENPTTLSKAWQHRLDESLPHWDCTVEVQQISATPDEFYNTEDPLEKANLLKRVEKTEELEAIEERLRTIQIRIEEERLKHAELEAKLAHTEQLELRWTTFDAHITTQRVQIERDVHEKLEAFRVKMRDKLGLTKEELTAELKEKSAPASLVEETTDMRNALDSELDTHKVDHLKKLQEVERELEQHDETTHSSNDKKDKKDQKDQQDFDDPQSTQS